MGICEPVPSEFTEEERQILESKATQEDGCCHTHIFCYSQEVCDSEYDDGEYDTILSLDPDSYIRWKRRCDD